MKYFLLSALSIFVTGVFAQVPETLSSFLNSDDFDKCEIKYSASGTGLDKIKIVKDFKMSQRAYCVVYLPELSKILSETPRVMSLFIRDPFPTPLVVSDAKDSVSYDEAEDVLFVPSKMSESVKAGFKKFEQQLEKLNPTFNFSGVKTNLPTSNLLGWRECFRAPYGTESELSDIQFNCSGKKVMMACAPKGAKNLVVAAMGDRDEVFRVTGGGENETHEHNGVNFYFTPGKSMGFAPANKSVKRVSCDDLKGNDRLCWHSSENKVHQGWRCGETQDIGRGFERIMFTAE